jgi:hypothetical protein
MYSIKSVLFGGLGNQMFQYAMGRSLSIKNGLPLTLDLSIFKIDDFYKREFELENFRIPEFISTINSSNLLSLTRFFTRLPRNTSLIREFFRPFCLLEGGKKFDDRATKYCPLNGCYVVGYWQDEKYFSSISSEIRAELKSARKLSEKNEQISSTIKNSSNSVAIHIRRMHGIPSGKRGMPNNDLIKTASLGLDYYDESVRQIALKIKDPTYFIFSDSPQWAKDNLKINGEVFFLENDRGENFEDMLLMSSCSHNVIANSSFSWWGAWLGQVEGRIVIAPKGKLYTPNIPDRWTSI